MKEMLWAKKRMLRDKEERMQQDEEKILRNKIKEQMQ